jgi:hypothetical protein
VEALVGRTPDGLPRWILLDPTPARERERIVARVGGVPAPVRTLTDAVRELWVNYIAGFDPERQERKFYGPIRAFGTWIIGGFLVVTRFFSRYFGDFFRFNRVEDVFSIKGFLVSVTLMVFALLILFGANRIWRWTSRLFTRSRSDEDSLLSEHVFYLRLQRALANAGIVRATNETPREFALRAGAFLSTVPDLADGLIEVPSKTIDAFYLMRFGQHELSPETSRWLDDRIAKLEAKVSNRPGARIR